MGVGHYLTAILTFAPLLAFAGLLRLLMSRAQSPPTGTPDKYEQLQKIADLKEKGVLTDREFDAEKRKILASDEGTGFPPKS